MAVHCYDDSTMNIVVSVTITIKVKVELDYIIVHSKAYPKP